MGGEGRHVDAGDGRPTGIRLLPYFDAYVVAAQPRELLYPGAAATRALSRQARRATTRSMLVDGVVGGVWHQKRSGRRVAITVEPLTPLSAAQRRQLEDEVALVGIASWRPSRRSSIGEVTVGAHA